MIFDYVNLNNLNILMRNYLIKLWARFWLHF